MTNEDMNWSSLYLAQTIPLMTSNNYKERFQAEYFQTKIRKEKLVKMLKDWDDGVLTFEPTCPRELLSKQCNIMAEYLAVLKQRADMEGVSLSPECLPSSFYQIPWF